MNLYHISQDEVDGWDTYDSAVVCAADEDAARNMHPHDGSPLKDTKYASDTWCASPEFVTVKFLGAAAPGVGEGVVCASFNAG